MSDLRQIGREARSQKRRTRFLLFALGGVFFLSMLVARPLMRLWAESRGRSHVAMAQAALAEEDFMAALDAVQKAAAQTPHDPEMLRTAVRALVGLNVHPDEILSTLSQVEAVGGLTPEMLIARAAAQLQRGDMLAAQQALNALPDAERQSWEAVELEAKLLLRQGRAAEAGERLQGQAEVEATPDTLFRRAVLDLAIVQDAAQRAPAEKLIWETARGSSADQRLALTLLTQEADLTATQAAELLDLVDHLPGPAVPELRYAVLGPVFRLAPERKEALIQAESVRAATLPTEQQVAYVLFLGKHKAPLAMRAFLTTHGQALARKRPGEFFSLELEALAKAEDWEAVRQKLKTPEARRMSSLSLHLWEANATAALDASSPKVLESLKLASGVTEKGRDPSGTLRVADSALTLGQPAFAAALFEQVAAQPRLLPAEKTRLLEKAAQAQQTVRDTAALRRIAHALADQMPGHLHHAYRAHYLDLLCGEPLDVIVQRLNAEDAGVAADPAAQARQRLLWALIYERRDQTEILRRELQGLEKAADWTPGERAVLAGLLAGAGEAARAWQLAEKLPRALLLPEEAAMAAAAK